MARLPGFAASLSTFLFGCARAPVPVGHDAAPSPVAVASSSVTAAPTASASTAVTPPSTSMDPVVAARAVCENAPASLLRKEALAALAAYRLGTRAFSLEAARVDRGACVSSLLPSALVTNLLTGVPAGVSLGMAIQETGGCGGRLVAWNNFHGQKANLGPSGFSHWMGEKVEIESSESPDAGGPKVKSAFMRLLHVDYSFEAMAERFVHPEVREHRYEPCLSLRDRPPAFARCIGRIWSVHVEYAERVLHHREQWDLARCELRQDELRLLPRFVLPSKKGAGP